MKINLTWYSDLQGKNPTQSPLIKCMSSVASVVFCASSIWEALHSRYSWFRLVPVSRLCISFASLHWLFPSSGLRIDVCSSFKNDLDLLFLILHPHRTNIPQLSQFSPERSGSAVLVVLSYGDIRDPRHGKVLGYLDLQNPVEWLWTS